MTIFTNSITISPIFLFKLAMLRHYQGKKWMFIALILGFIGYAFLLAYSPLRYYFIGTVSYAIILSFFIIIPYFYWQQVRSMKDKGAFLPRTYQISTEKIISRIKGGKIGEYPWSAFRHISKTSAYYLLFTSANHFLYIHKNAFQSNQDLKNFEEILDHKGLT